MVIQRICDICGSNKDVKIRNIKNVNYDLCLECHHSILCKTIHNLTTHNFIETNELDQLKNKFVQEKLKER